MQEGHRPLHPRPVILIQRFASRVGEVVRAQIAQTRRVVADERRPLIVVVGPVGRLGGVLRHGSGEVGGAAARAAEAVEVAADAGCGSRLTSVSMSGTTSYMSWSFAVEGTLGQELVALHKPGWSIGSGGAFLVQPEWKSDRQDRLAHKRRGVYETADSLIMVARVSVR